MSRCAFTREGSQSDRLVELLVFFVVCCWVVVYLDFFFKTPLRLFTPGILKEVGHRLVAEFEIARATDPAPFQGAIWFEMTLKDRICMSSFFFFVILTLLWIIWKEVPHSVLTCIFCCCCFRSLDRWCDGLFYRRMRAHRYVVYIYNLRGQIS